MAPLPPPPSFSAALFWAKALLFGALAIAGCVAIQGLLLGWFALLDAQVFLVLISARIVARAYDRATETPASAPVSRGTQTDGMSTPSHVRTRSRSSCIATIPTSTEPVKRLSAAAAPFTPSAATETATTQLSIYNDGKSSAGGSGKAVALGAEHEDNGPRTAPVGEQSGKGSRAMIAKRPAARLVKIIENAAPQGDSAPGTSGLSVPTVGTKAIVEEKPESAASGGDNGSPAAESTIRAEEHQKEDTRVAKTTQETPEFGIQQAMSATASMTRKVEYPRDIARRALADAFNERELARQRLNNAFSVTRSLEFGEKAKFYKKQRKALANMMPLGLLNEEDEARFPYLGSMDTKPPPKPTKPAPVQTESPPTVTHKPLTESAPSYSSPRNDMDAMISKTKKAYQVLLQTTKMAEKTCGACKSDFCTNSHPDAKHAKIRAAYDYYQKNRASLVEAHGGADLPEELRSLFPEVHVC